MKTLNDLYLKQPELLRKVERDFVVTFAGLVLASGVLSSDAPDVAALWSAVTAAAALAAWRIGRSLITRLSGAGA